MFPNVGFPELIIVMCLAILLFGKRLPEVARSMGKGIVEFKKGLSGITDELDITGTGSKPSSSYSSSWRSEEPAASDATYSDASVPKFELPGTVSSPSPAPSPAPTETVTVPTVPTHQSASELPRD
jgi:sec-independent protein translocase protein TatA